MPFPLPAWLQRAEQAIRDLADRPATLFCLLLAMNAVARPCYATAHDGRLYSLQALNRAEDGAFADDVFLRFGSQDQYSLFSRVVGPVTVVLGVRATFFIGYLVFNTLFILAMFRLVRTLIADPVISTLSLVYLVTGPLSYGGGDIFTVHEQFFTPRLIGQAFTLFALERLARHKFIQAIPLLLAGALVHPLMAFGGVMIWAGYVAASVLPIRAFIGLAIAALAGFAAILCIPAVATPLFGTMDDDWHHLVRLAVGYNYPDTWPLKDWLNAAMSLAMPIIACFALYQHDARRRRFFAIAALAGIIGLAVTIAASFLPYALLFQGQPYRVLWILKVLQIPLGFALIAHWSRSAALSGRLAALALIANFCILYGVANEFLIVGMAVAISLALAYLSGDPVPAGWWWYGTARGLALGALAWMAYRSWFVFQHRDVFAKHFDFCEWTMFDLISPIFWLAALCLGLGFWKTPNFPAVRWAGAAIALLAPIALFAAEADPGIRRDHTRHGSDAEFVRDFIHRHDGTAARHPAIYWQPTRIDLVWTDVKATSYFSILQTAGVMFNRQTAHEIDRRIARVARFEMARQRELKILLDDDKIAGLENLLKVPFDCPPPTRDDLIRLCQEPGLDYVVIEEEFPGLYSASNGRLYVYECYKVKTSSLSARAQAPALPSPALQRGR